MKIIEPGATKSNFNADSLVEFQNEEIRDYKDYVKQLTGFKIQSFSDAILPVEVALTIYEAVFEPSDRLRFLVGNRRSKTLAFLRKILPTAWFIFLLRKRINLK